MARIGRCQTILVGNEIYYYGRTIPHLRWKDSSGEEKELWNAKIVAVSGIRENNAQFEGTDNNGK